ncbi:MAG: response regulator [Chloroflexi bacterium]|nr:response regulator [Chloroflexota bacterium]
MSAARRNDQPHTGIDHPPRVLVIEDEHDVCELLADTLSLEGYQVRTSEEAHGVLSLIRRSRPDLIILDLCLPGVSGIQLLPLLARDAPAVPVLIASGSRDLLREHADDLRRLCAAVLEKPFSLDQFMSAVNKALASGQRRSSASPPPSRRGSSRTRS